MAVVNEDIASIFNKVAAFYEIKGENPFKVRAYRNAARTIQNLGTSIVDMLNQGQDLRELPGIGKDLEQDIREIVATGRLKKLEDLQRSIPPALIELLAIEGLGPKRIKTLYEKLNIKSLDDLREAAKSGAIEALPGFGKKSVEQILKGVRLAKKEGHRFRWAIAELYANDLLDYLRQIKGIENLVVAGSFRRKKDTVGDLDILATARNWDVITEHFVGFDKVKFVVSKGPTRSTVVLKNDLQVDLRSVAVENYGSALCYFTGSKAHNIAVRKIAVERGLKINEYGVFKGETRVAGKTEEEVYKSVGLPYIEPELREDRGEIEAARAGRLPRLIELKDLKGDLHCHTTYTDGKNTLEEMAMAAMELGHEYIAITDHSKHLTVARGLDEKRLRQQIEEVDRLNQKITGLTLLKGIEVDILEDGTLDLPDSVLKELDLVVGAIHYKFKLSREAQTKRMIRAMDNPYLNILAHPTGRLLGERESYAINIEEVMVAAKERGCCLELNSQPDRLDLNDVNCRLAKEMGIKISISTDAHNTFSLSYQRYGINQARRGWLEKTDVVNTLGLEELRRILKRG